MDTERKQHLARMEKEMMRHNEVMAKLEADLSSSWQALMVSQMARQQVAAARASRDAQEKAKEEAAPAPVIEQKQEEAVSPVKAVAVEESAPVETAVEVAPTEERAAGEWVLEETPNGLLSNGGLGLTKHSESKSWDCDTRGSEGWTEGVHEWWVKLDNGGNGVGLGICLGSISLTDDAHNGNLSFLINCTTGAAYDESGNKKPVFAATSGGMVAGSVVAIRLDLDEKTLSFGLNGKGLDEPTFTDLPEDTWYPFVAIGVPNKSVTVYRGSVAPPEPPVEEEAAAETVEGPEVQEEQEQNEGEWTLAETPNGSLSENGLTLTKTSEGKGWDCDTLGTLGWTEGVHEWAVRLDNGGNGVGLGICLGSISKTEDSNNSNISFIINCTTGAAYDDSGNKSRVFAVRSGGMSEGSIVSIKLDLDERTLAFGLNGSWLDKSTFTDLPEDTWYPFLALGVQNKSVSVFRGDLEVPAPPEDVPEVEAAQTATEEDWSDWVLDETPNGQLSETGLCLVKSSEGKGWDCDTLGTHGWYEGVHEWAVRLDNGGNNVGLGICLGSISKTDDAQNGNLSFLINCTTGAAYDESGNKKPVFNVPGGGMAVGSIVFVKLDLDAKTLSFGLNEKPTEPTFRDLPEDTWYPFFALGSQNKVISVYRGDVAPPEPPKAEEADAADENGVQEEQVAGEWVLEETPNGHLSSGGLVVTKTTDSKSWDCDTRGSEGWTEGVHEWWVKLDNGGNGVGLGICLGSISLTDDAHNGNLSFLINCTTGAAYDESGNKKPVFNVPAGGMTLGSVVTVRLDLDEKTLSFGLNGKGLDVPTFTDLPEDTWYPFVALGAPNKSVSFYRGDMTLPEAPIVEPRAAKSQPQKRIGGTIKGPLSPRDETSIVRTRKQPLDEKDEGVVVPKEKKSVRELAKAHEDAQVEAMSPRSHSAPEDIAASSPVAVSPKPVALPGGAAHQPAKVGRGRGVGRGMAKKPSVE